MRVHRFSALPDIELWEAPARAPLWLGFPWGFGIAWTTGDPFDCRHRSGRFDFGSPRIVVSGPADLPVLASEAGHFWVLVVDAALMNRAAGGVMDRAPLDAGPVEHQGAWQALDELRRTLFATAGGAPALEECLALLVGALSARAQTGHSFLPDQVLQKALRFLQTRYPHQVHLDDLAEACALSKFHLARRFSAGCGVSPYQMLKRIRVARALELLRLGRRPSDVAPAVGFADQSHMTRVFRQQLGFTPGAYGRGMPGR